MQDDLKTHLYRRRVWKPKLDLPLHLSFSWKLQYSYCSRQTCVHSASSLSGPPLSPGLLITLQPAPKLLLTVGTECPPSSPPLKPSILKDPAQPHFLRESSHCYSLRNRPPLKSLTLRVLFFHSLIPTVPGSHKDPGGDLQALRSTRPVLA